MTLVKYSWNPLEDNIMAEYDGAGNLLARYTTEPELYGNVISQNRGGVNSYFHHDGIGNTIAVTNENGDVTDTRAYNAFGEITESTGTTEFPFQFVGQKGYYHDVETGEYSVRRRPYQPAIVRWKSVDPLEWRNISRNPSAARSYGYVQNRPLSHVDATGMISSEFSRPTDDEFEFYDEIDNFGFPLPDGAIHEPWETARIKVTITADTSRCKCVCSPSINESIGALDLYKCRGSLTLTFKYRATLTSFNPLGSPPPNEDAELYGVEVDNTGVFVDDFFPLEVVNPPGGGIIGTIAIASVKHDRACHGGIGLLGWGMQGGCNDLTITQVYKIRSRFDSGVTIVDQIYRYRLTNDCGGDHRETLTGKMGRSANGPLRQIPPDTPYGSSPFPGQSP